MYRQVEEKLYDIAEANEIEIEFYNLFNKLGISVLYCDKYIIGINKSLKKGVKYNEVLAHELAHCMMKNLYLIAEKNPLRKINIGYYERQAKDWCVVNLLPFEKLKKAIDKYCDDGNLYFVCDYFSCSIEFIKYAIKYYEMRGYEF